MAITDDLRKTLTDPTPLYFAAGTADIAVEQARKVPALIEQLRAEAPERIEAVRNTDPKAARERVGTQAREAQATVQAKVTEVLGSLDTDLKKLGETAQDLALRSVGVAAEYAVRARETYEKVAERGERSVRTWRGETAEEVVEITTVVEAEPSPAATPKSETVAPAPEPRTVAAAPAPAEKPAPKAAPKTAEAKTAPAAPARKAATRKPAAKKATPPPSAK
ncbi:hypothetical protein STHAL_11510 [Streptomyces halstedii]|uniref:Heparin binding hemagglutinin HbhA n=1 Tax=Streptomyces halstedii TaxID=1944 RepID=A0ABS6TPH4_STRHA|nr:hypothetical protein [Streptomyces halstedii]MBV7670092.1 hypothetical protein [Streptomyces halstedii]